MVFSLIAQHFNPKKLTCSKSSAGIGISSTLPVEMVMDPWWTESSDVEGKPGISSTFTLTGLGSRSSNLLFRHGRSGKKVS
jgi:hypothetical protein